MRVLGINSKTGMVYLMITSGDLAGTVIEAGDKGFVYKNVPGWKNSKRSRPEHGDVLSFGELLKQTPDLQAPENLIKMNDFIRHLHIRPVFGGT